MATAAVTALVAEHMTGFTSLCTTVETGTSPRSQEQMNMIREQ
jgi:hypothetical protein